MKRKCYQKFLSCILSFMLLAVSPVATAFAASNDLKPEKAPLNEDFKKYLESIKNGEKIYNHIPSPVKILHTNSSKKYFKSVSYPSKFDLREEGKLTPVKNQGDQGACWAFATYGALESSLLPNESWDFSEDNLSMRHGFDWGVEDGGNKFISAAYLARWDGPILEVDDPYNDGISPDNLPVRKHVQQIICPSREEIKESLMTYGAVHTGIFAGENEDDDALYYNPDTYSYYYYGDSQPNHDIAIIGWDDEYSADNFVQEPPSDGAFICRNSWGDEWGENGYYYVSYYDTILGYDNAVYSGIEEADNYDTIYQYDPLGWTNNTGYNNETAWFANIFTKNSSETENLSAISFYTTTDNAAYEIYVNPNFKNGDFSNKTKIKSGIIETPGYHTISLDDPILLEKSKFAIAVKLTTPGNEYPIPIESPIEDYTSNASANSGEGYISPDGEHWQDIISNDEYQNTSVCLKAFTKKLADPIGPINPIDLSNSYKWKEQNNIPSNKIWKIKFNQLLNTDNITSQYVKVLESETLEEVSIDLNYDENNNVIEVSPVNNYDSNKSYYLYLDKNIQSISGKNLKQSISMKFNIQ